MKNLPYAKIMWFIGGLLPLCLIIVSLSNLQGKIPSNIWQYFNVMSWLLCSSIICLSNSLNIHSPKIFGICIYLLSGLLAIIMSYYDLYSVMILNGFMPIIIILLLAETTSCKYHPVNRKFIMICSSVLFILSYFYYWEPIEVRIHNNHYNLHENIDTIIPGGLLALGNSILFTVSFNILLFGVNILYGFLKSLVLTNFTQSKKHIKEDIA